MFFMSERPPFPDYHHIRYFVWFRNPSNTETDIYRIELPAAYCEAAVEQYFQLTDCLVHTLEPDLTFAGFRDSITPTSDAPAKVSGSYQALRHGRIFNLDNCELVIKFDEDEPELKATDKKPAIWHGKLVYQSPANCLSPAVTEKKPLDTLGQPLATAPRSLSAEMQHFERGRMVRLLVRPGDALTPHSLLVLANDRRAYAAAPLPGDEAAFAAASRKNLYPACVKPWPLMSHVHETPGQNGYPWRHFGRLWCDSPPLKEGIGRVTATSEEQRIKVQVQEYESGIELTIGDEHIFVHYSADPPRDAQQGAPNRAIVCGR